MCCPWFKLEDGSHVEGYITLTYSTSQHEEHGIEDVQMKLAVSKTAGNDLFTIIMSTLTPKRICSVTMHTNISLTMEPNFTVTTTSTPRGSQTSLCERVIVH